MSLVIENGSLVAGATSYVSVENARAFADARALTLPADDIKVEVALIVAMDYLESNYRALWQGQKVDKGQSLQWPRQDVSIDGADFPNNTIPKELIAAQILLAVESAAGVDLQPSGDGREIIAEKIDVIETHYQPGTTGATQPIFSKVRALLAPLMRAGGFRLTVSRA